MSAFDSDQRPSLTAAQTFRYQPRIVEGRAVTVSGVKNTFHYRIKQDYRVLQAVL
ncbi:hypothetical protein ALQ93_200217 [Pseudomonas syringae pv. pisi]|uniref:TonB protein n=4 Tax=Pseudomonas syringae group TaxID=136849 RepID=F3GII2_PSESJ|nr:tonB protein [Pseudomonas syringae pv. pisi str. 1704B]PYD11092.1 energy transducer TonB [Pseudomonas syringae pv. pisi]RMU68028.1 TonB protein [Pseudomonas syringae pv. aptata]RMU88072.1 TonB protein [Pseudomonas savastanoi pv. phaseolicola]EGH48009.1 tonB protein [Pseudomonas syringae pv. pisi str. 1704B]